MSNQKSNTYRDMLEHKENELYQTYTALRIREGTHKKQIALLE